MIRVLFIDLFGVLIGSNENSILKYVGENSECDLLTIKSVIFGELCMQLERKEISFNEYYQIILSKLNCNLDFITFQSIWINMEMGLLPMTQYISKYSKHFKLYILSNTTNRHINIIRKKYPFISQFDGIITSEQAGAHKPDQKIFEYASQLVNQKFKHCAFIDDCSFNVQAALALGINSHLYQKEDELILFLDGLL